MPKDTKSRLLQISKAAGVSPATVSRVMNHPELVKKETAQLVTNAMQALGIEGKKKETAPLPKKKTILMNAPYLDQFYLEISNGVKNAIEASGYFMVTSYYDIGENNIKSFLELIRGVNACGVIITNSLSKELLDAIEKEVPAIQCCEFNPDVSIPYVTVDDFSGAQRATEYMINCGRTKIGFVSGPRKYKYATERRHGYHYAMSQARLPIERFWEIELPSNSYEMAYSAVKQLLQFDDGHPDAFLCTSDILAMATIRAAVQKGLSVPNDVMVIGFDDIQFASMMIPSLTTVRQPVNQIGYTACNMLIQRLVNPTMPLNAMILDTELIIRESTSSQNLIR